MLRSLSPSPTFIPQTDSPLVGRSDELAQLRQVVQDNRLVTVLGTSGIGKTRLVVELLRERPDAVFVDLTEQRDREGVLSAVGGALDVRAPVAGAVIDAINERGDTLIVLDNLEQAVGAAPETVGSWLSECPRAHFLVTSRELLRLRGERVLELSPLSLPETDDDVSEALLLWVQERRRTEPAYNPTDERATVCEILRQLDGLPLAIELAAARAPVLGVDDLLQRLAHRFSVLARGARGAPRRQATLRGAIDWSWELLSPVEQRALAQCSVFRGGFTVVAAEAVLAPDSQVATLDLIQSLREKSLLRSLPGTPPRLDMFLSIRDYAAERLAELDGDAATLTRANEYFGELAARLQPAVETPDGGAALRDIVAEKQNLIATVERSSNDVGASIVVCASCLLALDDVAWTRGPVNLHVDVLNRAIARFELTDPSDVRLARMLELRGIARASSGDVDAGVADAARALELCEAADDELALARALMSMAKVRLRQRDLVANEQLLLRARDAAIAAGDRRLEGMIIGTLGDAPKLREDFAGAEALYREALAIHERIGNRRSEGMECTRLSVLFLEQGRFEELTVMATRALAIHRELDSRYVQGLVLTALGAAHHAQGRIVDARQAYLSAVPLQQAMGEKRIYGATLGYLGLAELELGEPEAGLSHLRQAHEMLEKLHQPRHHALFLAFHAGAEAGLGRESRARKLLRRAGKILAEHPDDKFETVQALMHSALDPLVARSTLDTTILTGGAEVSRSIDVRLALRLVERRAATATVAGDEPGLVVDAMGKWFELTDGTRVDCRRRHAARRLLLKLAHQCIYHPGVPLSAAELVSAGWPEERMTVESAQNRLYVTLNRLRALGLRGVLLAVEGGYLIDRNHPVRFSQD